MRSHPVLRFGAQASLTCACLLPFAGQAADGGTSTPPAPAAPPAAATTPSAAPAPTVAAPIGLEATGFAYTRFERYNGYNNFAGTAGGMSGDAVRYRFMLGLQTTPIALTEGYSLVVKVTPQLSGFWHVGGDTLEDSGLLVHEGLMRFQGPNFKLEAGRMEMAYGDELVVGAVRWNHVGRAFDGARLHVEPGDGAYVDMFAMQLTEGTVEVAAGTGQTGDTLTAGDRYFLGLYAGFGPKIKKGLELDFYLFDVRVPPFSYTVEDVTTDVLGGDELTVGLRTKGKVSLVDWRVEVGAQLGSRAVAAAQVGAQGMQADAELGVNLGVLSGLRLGVEGFYASGDDATTTDVNEAWNPLFPTAHKWLGWMDYVDKKGNRSNIMGGVGHLKLGILPPLNLLMDVHQFSRPQPALEGQSSGGMELDTGLSYSVGKALTFRGTYNIFVKNEADAALSASDKDTLSMVELEMGAKF